MITVIVFINKALDIAATHPKYRLGCDGSNGYCDCIGLPIGSLKRAGVKWQGIHGSNYAARYRLKVAIKPINKVSDLKVGMLVFKGKTDTADLPNRYKRGGSLYNGDLHDYYHVGMVISVNPLCILHMTSPTTKKDTSLGKWNYYGECVYVESCSPSPTPAPPPVENILAEVIAASGSTVNMRKGPGKNYKIVERVPIGAIVEVLEDDGSDWTFIQYKLKSGYMMDMFLHEVDRKEVG